MCSIQAIRIVTWEDTCRMRRRNAATPALVHRFDVGLVPERCVSAAWTREPLAPIYICNQTCQHFKGARRPSGGYASYSRLRQRLHYAWALTTLVSDHAESHPEHTFAAHAE